MDPTTAANWQELAEYLRELWIKADKPSYRRLGNWAIRQGKTLSRTSISEVLNGKQIPRKAFLLAFIESCGVDPESDKRWAQTWNRLASDPATAEALVAGSNQPQGPIQETLDQAQERIEQLESALYEARAAAEEARSEAAGLRSDLDATYSYIDLWLVKLGPQNGSSLLEIMSPAAAASRMSGMKPEDAASYLMAMEERKAGQVVAAMDKRAALGIISNLSPQNIVTLLRSGGEALLAAFDEEIANEALNSVDPVIAASLMTAVPPDWAAKHLRTMDTSLSSQVLSLMPPSAVVQVLRAVDQKVVAWLAAIDPTHTHRILSDLNKNWTTIRLEEFKSEERWELESAIHTLVRECLSCQHPVSEDARFCGNCGLLVREKVGIVSHNEDRRRISVLFVDIVDATSIVEQADSGLVRRAWTGYFSATSRVVKQFGGVVEQYIGDAVMALFGAPVASETDALRCVRAGLELQRELTLQMDSGAAEPFRFRIGIATGEALVDISGDHGGGMIVAGDVVNTASRLQSVTPPGGVLVCGNTHALTREAIRYEEQPPALLKGRSTPAEVWLAVAPTGRSAEGEPALIPLVDREHEFGLLIDALHKVTCDHSRQIVTIVGDAGIGKSRLVRELFQYTDELAEVITWRTGRCLPFGQNVTFSALADIVKAQAGILDTDPALVAEQRLRAAVTDLVDAGPIDQVVGALRPLVGLPGTNLPVEETESAWRRFLLALAQQRPTVLVFEDLHWADEAMLRFVELLGATARDTPLMLICTARPELTSREPSWSTTLSGSMTVTLRPLRESGITALYTHLLGDGQFPPESLRALIEVAGGNPLYALEYVRMLIEQGALRKQGQSWTLEQPADLPIPDSVHAVIANRVDLLDAEDRAVLLAASVVGMQFWPGAVAAALGVPVDMVEWALRRLEQRDFVHEQAASLMGNQAEFRFQHILVRDVCYQRLPRTERVARHERTANWLDSLSRSRDTDLAEVLAHHRWAAHEIAHILGMDTDRYAPAARTALHRAARRAYALHALDTAQTNIHRALALFGPTVESEAQERLQLELLDAEIAFYRDHAAFLAEGGEQRLTCLARQLGEQGDHGHAARALTLLGQAAWLRADQPSALSYLDRAVELFDSEPDSPGKADAHAELGRLHMLNFERDPAVAAAGVAAQIAERLGLTEIEANARITIGSARYQAGDPTGLTELEDVLEFCRRHQLRAGRRAARNLASAVLEEGDWVRSKALLAEADQMEQDSRDLDTVASSDAMSAYYIGDLDKFLAAAEPFINTPAGRWDLQVRGLRSCLKVLRDELLPGTDDIADALAMVRDGGFHRPLWTALGQGALCRALQGRLDEAAALLSELVEECRDVTTLVSGEWSGAISVAATLCGRDSLRQIASLIDQTPHLTRWGRAAAHTVTAALADADGDHTRAATELTTAAQIYAGIPSTTDHMITLALTVHALRRAGDEAAAASLLLEVQEFAMANKAPGILRLAELDRR